MDIYVSRDWIVQKMQEFDLPYYMVEGVYNYLMYGVTPGSFLTAILKNDLRTAVMKADGNNQRRIVEWVKFCYNYLPCISWGSEEYFMQWTNSFRKEET